MLVAFHLQFIFTFWKLKRTEDFITTWNEEVEWIFQHDLIIKREINFNDQAATGIKVHSVISRYNN